MEAKLQVRDLLDRLPDDRSLDDVHHHLYAGRVIPHAEFAEALRRRWQVGTGE